MQQIFNLVWMCVKWDFQENLLLNITSENNYFLHYFSVIYCWFDMNIFTSVAKSHTLCFTNIQGEFVNVKPVLNLVTSFPLRLCSSVCLSYEHTTTHCDHTTVSHYEMKTVVWFAKIFFFPGFKLLQSLSNDPTDKRAAP